MHRFSITFACLVLLVAAAGCGPGVCFVDGQVRLWGESWQCSDGCNTCSCSPGGVETTLMACAPPDAGSADAGD